MFKGSRDRLYDLFPDLLPLRRRRRALASVSADHFWALVARTDDADSCWLWQGVQDDAGYGSYRGQPAHRVAWMLAHPRSNPAGFDVCHHCDTPRCVRHSHLFLGTDAINARDACKKHQRRQICISPNHNTTYVVTIQRGSKWFSVRLPRPR